MRHGLRKVPRVVPQMETSAVSLTEGSVKATIFRSLCGRIYGRLRKTDHETGSVRYSLRKTPRAVPKIHAGAGLCESLQYAQLALAIMQREREVFADAQMHALAGLRIEHRERRFRRANVGGLRGIGVQSDEQQHLVAAERIANAERNVTMHRVCEQTVTGTPTPSGCVRLPSASNSGARGAESVSPSLSEQ